MNEVQRHCGFCWTMYGPAEAEHLGASVADASLPRCSIDVTNMSGFRLSSLEPQVRDCIVN